MPEYLVSFIDYVNNLPLALRLVTVALASTIEYVFPIFPGDTVVLMAGFLSAQGALGLLELSVAVLLGTLLGCTITYSIGRAVANGQIGRHWIDKIASKQALARWHAWFHRWGYFLILANRFFVGIRSFFFVAAGLYRLPFGIVLLCGAISAIIFNGLIVALGYFLGNNVDMILNILHNYTRLVYVILALIAAIIIAVKTRHWYIERRAVNKSKSQDS